METRTLEQVPQRVRDLFNKGFGALERGNLDYAVDLLTECVELEPGLLQARKYLRAAEIQRVRQRKSNALSGAVRQVSLLPAYGKAMALLKSGKGEQAVMAAERLLRDDPLNAKYLLLLAQAAAAAGLTEAGVQALELAREYHPSNVVVINRLGALYLRDGRTREARECFERLCEISPNDPGAVKALKDAMALDSMSTDGWSRAADGGTYRDVIKDTDEAVLREQESKAVKSEKDADALIDSTLKKIEAEPENVNYYRQLARLYGQRDDFEEAMTALERALELAPGDPALDSERSAMRLRKLDHEIEQLAASGKDAEAEARREERNAFAFEDLKDRAERYPNELRIRYDLGRAMFERGMLNEAIQQFQVAQRSPHYRVSSLHHLAICFKQKRQFDLAYDQLKRAAEDLVGMDATKKEITYELGQVSEAMGKREQALEYYKQIYQADIGYKDVAEKVEQQYGTQGDS